MYLRYEHFFYSDASILKAYSIYYYELEVHFKSNAEMPAGRLDVPSVGIWSSSGERSLMFLKCGSRKAPVFQYQHSIQKA